MLVGFRAEKRLSLFTRLITHREDMGIQNRTESGLGAPDMLPIKLVPFPSLANMSSGTLTENTFFKIKI